MSFEPFSSITSGTIVLSQNNIDTDQIIPARFLTTTSRSGLGKSVFYDWRYDAQGDLRADSVLDAVPPESHQVLVAGANFGCGSSREHAPWALSDFGFRVVISSDIADIFKSNALKNGLLPVEIDNAAHAELLSMPGQDVTVDLEKQIVTYGADRSASFNVEPFARRCLLDGVDPLGHLLNQMDTVQQYESARS
ncbi:MAG: 3-isopropylmalate dehydratase small subunit [Aquisalinus sp.]|nr:3-isopropylmalate dehydratase small subunit [Aquisalinus sp.]